MTENLNETEVVFLKKAELLMEIKGYQKESLKQNGKTIDIQVSKPDSDETVLMHLVTSDTVNIEQAKETRKMLKEPDIDKIIVFGNKFTDSARKKLSEADIEFFSEKKKVVSTLAPQELYTTIMAFVDKLCQIKCEYIPKSESECKSLKENHYSCKVRLISDNADFHQEKGWITLLQNDLRLLLEISSENNTSNAS